VTVRRDICCELPQRAKPLDLSEQPPGFSGSWVAGQLLGTGAAVFPWQVMDESLVREARLKPRQGGANGRHVRRKHGHKEVEGSLRDRPRFRSHTLANGFVVPKCAAMYSFWERL